MNETMFCRICLVPTVYHQPMHGKLFDTIEKLLQNRSLKNIENPIVCDHCIAKTQKALDFKLACMNTRVTLSNYVVSQKNAKIDLNMIYSVERTHWKNGNSFEEMKICRTCLNIIEDGQYACLLDSIRVNNWEDMCEQYIPELVLKLTESPLICEKCIYNFRCFSDMISTILDTEDRIDEFCEPLECEESAVFYPGGIMDASKGKKCIKGVNEEPKMKLFRDELPLDSCRYSDRKSALKDEDDLIIKEDIDLFFKEESDSDSEEGAFEDSENDSYQESREMEQPDGKHQTNECGIEENQNTLDGSQSLRSEEAPSSLEIMGPAKWFNSRTSRPKTRNSDQLELKKWQPIYNGRVPTRVNGKKCRSVYGLKHKELWCLQCRWKKACTKFTNLHKISDR